MKLLYVVLQPRTKIMAGKDYYTMLRARSLILAAFFELHWRSFHQWLIYKHDEDSGDLQYVALFIENVSNLAKFVSEPNLQTSKELLQTLSKFDERLNRLITQFHESNCSSPTSKFWLMYIDMVQILKRYVHSERAGLWDEHLTEAENMMPYMVGTVHHKYVSCLPHDLESIKQLSTTAPYVYEAFKRGNFNVHQTQGNFNEVWSDMALEQAYNCDAKTQLFSGITQQPQAIGKYLKALPVMTSVSEQVKTMVLDIAEKDMQLVKETANVVQTKVLNPFMEAKDDLINISNGKKCASIDIDNAKQVGQDALSAAQEMGSSSAKSVKLQTHFCHVIKLFKKLEILLATEIFFWQLLCYSASIF